MKDWPRGTERYLPIEAAEFERLLATAGNAAAGTPAQAAARVVAAQYTARLDSKRALRGEAVLEIDATAKNPVMMSLSPCNLAVSEARWGSAERRGRSSDSMPKADCKPSWNTAEVCISPGRLPAGATPRMSWSFLSSCPRAASIGSPWTCRRALRRRSNSASSPRPARPARNSAIGNSSWAAIHASSFASCRRGPRRPHRLALVRQSTVYDLSLRGVEVSAQLKIEAYDRPLQQVTLALDPQMQLVAALSGDLAASWSVVSPPGAPMTRVVVTLPAPIRDGVGLLRLRALSPLVMGQAWRLPRIGPEIAAEVGNEAIFWQGGDATLLVPAPLVAERLQPIHCRQSGVGPLSGARSGESTQWEYFSPDATVEVRLAERAARRRKCFAPPRQNWASKRSPAASRPTFTRPRTQCSPWKPR